MFGGILVTLRITHTFTVLNDVGTEVPLIVKAGSLGLVLSPSSGTDAEVWFFEAEPLDIRKYQEGTAHDRFPLGRRIPKTMLGDYQTLKPSERKIWEGNFGCGNITIEYLGGVVFKMKYIGDGTQIFPVIFNTQVSVTLISLGVKGNDPLFAEAMNFVKQHSHFDPDY